MKKQIKITELQMDYLVMEGLLKEENEVFTEYGKGLVYAYLNSNIKKSMPVVPNEVHDKLQKECNKLIDEKKELENRNNRLIQLLQKRKKSWWKHLLRI